MNQGLVAGGYLIDFQLKFEKNLTCESMMMINRLILNRSNQILSFFELIVEKQMLRKIGDFYPLFDFVLRYKFVNLVQIRLNLPLTISNASSKLSSSGIFFCLRLSVVLKNLILLRKSAQLFFEWHHYSTFSKIQSRELRETEALCQSDR